jgi:hypothetical protein
MERLKDVVVRIGESLEALSEALNTIGQSLDEYVKSKKTAPAETKPPARKARSAKKKAKAPARKRRAKVKTKVSTAKKPAKATAPAVVLEIIKKSDNGATIAHLKEQTGFDGKKIANSIYRLKKQGAIKATGRGVYTSL